MKHPDWTAILTFRQSLAPAMEVQTKEEADEYLISMANYHCRQSKTLSLDDAIKLAKTNIGYYAGYYGPETSERVYRLFATEHPVFGKEQPTADEALGAGMKLAKRMGPPK